MFNLPSELVQHIFEFCINKRLSWNKLNQQFMKGGFHRKNLKIETYLKKEKWCARRFWTGTRLNLSPIKNGSQHSSTNVYILKREWDCKNKSARYEYEHTLHSGRIIRRSVNSGANPVSKWLKNIERFELTHPTLVSYLTEKREFNVNFNSIFYKKRRQKKKDHKLQDLKKLEKKTRVDNLLAETKLQKLKASMVYGFKVGQLVSISCLKTQFPCGSFINPNYVWLNPPLGDSVTEGKITRISVWLKQNHKRYNKLCPFSVAKSFHVQITISTVTPSCFFAHYTPEVLTDIIKLTKEFSEMSDDKEYVELSSIDINGVTYLHDPHGIYAGIKHLILSEEGTPLGIYDKENNTLIEYEFEI